MAFLALIEIELHFPEGSDLKGKRKQVKSVKAGLQQRFDAAVAETDHHDLWQRATLTAALVAREPSGVADRADALERWLHGRVPDGVSLRRTIMSAEELREG